MREPRFPDSLSGNPITLMTGRVIGFPDGSSGKPHKGPAGALL